MAKIHVSQSISISDTKISIKVSGISPKTVFTLHSSTKTDSGNLFECVVQYKADSKGCIDLDCDEALSGSYTGIEPMGIFWAMEGSPSNKNKFARFAKLDITTPLVVTLSVYADNINDLEQLNTLQDSNALKNSFLASTEIKRLFMAPGTTRIPLTVAKDGIHGTLFVPPGKGPFPAVVLMFGSYAGTMEFKASLLASHGFVTLALAFFGVPGLPQFYLGSGDWNLRLEYFEKVAEYLSTAPKVDKAKGLGVVVLSFSGFIGLAMAAFLPHVRCVVSVNASTHVQFSTLSYKDREFEPVTHLITSDIETDTVGPLGLRRMCPVFDQSFALEKPAPEDAGLRFCERRDVAFMYLAGLSDSNVISEHYANRVERLLRLSKHPNFEVLRYPGAGHLLEPPYSVHNKETVVLGNLLDWGGVRKAHCKAQEDSWRRQVDFLRKNLTLRVDPKL